MQLPDHQRGVAIVLAMSVVAMAALAATAMAVSQSTWFRQVELGTSHAQALLIMNGGLNWSRAILGDDKRAGNVDYNGEPWAMQLPAIPVDNGSLTGHIDDQQAKFNLNNLLKDDKINPAQLASFRRLLSTLSLPATLADTLCANLPLVDTSELASLPGFDDKVRTRLQPFVTALPHFSAINVNTASPEVISAVIDGLTLDDARAIIAQRDRLVFFRNLSDFSSQIPAGFIVPTENISVNSGYFMVSMVTTINGVEARGSALLARENATWPSVVWRKYQ